jgi:hypothetical protein
MVPEAVATWRDQLQPPGGNRNGRWRRERKPEDAGVPQPTADARRADFTACSPRPGRGRALPLVGLLLCQ